MSKKILLSFFIFVAFFIVSSGCSKKKSVDSDMNEKQLSATSTGSEYASDSAVVIVNGEIIYNKDITPFIEAIVEQELLRWQMSFNSETPESFKQELYDSIRNHIIEQFVIDKLLLQAAKKNNIIVDEEEIKNEIEMVKNQTTDTAGHSTFNKFLEKMGFADEKIFAQKIKDKLMVVKYSQTTLETNPEYNDENLKKYYEEHKQLFAHPESRKVEHILTIVSNDSSAEENAEQLKKIKLAKEQLNKKIAFEKVAADLSECESKTNGGFIGFLEVTGKEDDILSQTAVKLKQNQISDIIKSERGYHIVRVPEIKKSYIDEFEKVRGRLRLMYLIDKHKSPAKIEYLN